MKICLLTPEFRPSWGGVGTYTYYLANGLRDRAEVHILTTSRSSADDGGGVDGVQVHVIGAHGVLNGFAQPLRFQLAVSRVLPKLARRYGFDLVHSNHAYMSDLFARNSAASPKGVLTVHTTLATQMYGTRQANSNLLAHPIERRVLRWRHLLTRIERRYLERAHSVIFVSEWVRNQTLSTYGITPRHSAVVRNGVDTQLFAPTINESRFAEDSNGRGPTLLFVGRLLALKGLGTLLAAMRFLRPNARLLLAGPGDPAPWRSTARRLGIDPTRCDFLGQVAFERMPALYRKASVVVLPSFTESCPMVALEAMASGVPLIAARAGGLAEIVHNGVTGLSFTPGDAAELAGQVDRALSDESLSRRLTTSARRWVERYASVEQMTSETSRFYEQVLGGQAK